MSGGEGHIPKILVDQYKITTQEIVVTAVLDITENVVLYAFPLYQMSVLKRCLKTVLEIRARNCDSLVANATKN